MDEYETVYVEVRTGRVWRRVTAEMASVLKAQYQDGLFRRAKSNGRTLEIRPKSSFIIVRTK